MNGLGYVDPPSIVVALLSAFPISICLILAEKWGMGWKMNIIPILSSALARLRRGHKGMCGSNAFILVVMGLAHKR